MSFYREWHSLQSLNHENVVRLRDIECSVSGATVYLVMDYCDFDLHALISSRGLPLAQARVIMRQLLEGLAYIHAAGFAHRDIKPPNIFVTADNVVKIGDFGLTRDLANCRGRRLSNSVITPSYRSPEILLGDDRYGCGVDVWSLACVFFEIATGETLFLPSTALDMDQLKCIFEKCGTPTPESWPGVEGLPGYPFIAGLRAMPSRLGEVLEKHLPPEFLGLKNLLEGMLVLDPAQRWTVEMALAHPFFANWERPEDLPKIRMKESHGTAPTRTLRTRAVVAPPRPFRACAPPPALALDIRNGFVPCLCTFSQTSCLC
jgi:serine/threonine protein kinase